MPPTVDKQYVYVAYKKGVVGSDGTFSAPKLFNRFPKSIAKQETKFYAHSSLTSAPKMMYCGTQAVRQCRRISATHTLGCGRLSEQPILMVLRTMWFPARVIRRRMV